MKDRLLSTLGICRKAGKLSLGFEAVAEKAAAGGIFLILVSRDLSPKSAKEMAFVTAKHNIPICTAPFDMEEVLQRLGKRSGIIGVADQGLADTLMQTCRACEEE